MRPSLAPLSDPSRAASLRCPRSADSIIATSVARRSRSRRTSLAREKIGAGSRDDPVAGRAVDLRPCPTRWPVPHNGLSDRSHDRPPISIHGFSRRDRVLANDTQILKQSTRAPSKLLGHNLEPDCEHLGYRFGISNGTAGMIQATGLGIAEHRNRRRRMENGLSEGLAAQGLFGVLYNELHRLAKRELAQ